MKYDRNDPGKKLRMPAKLIDPVFSGRTTAAPFRRVQFYELMRLMSTAEFLCCNLSLKQ